MASHLVPLTHQERILRAKPGIIPNHCQLWKEGEKGRILTKDMILKRKNVGDIMLSEISL